MSVKIMCSFVKEGDLRVLEIEPMEILAEISKAASESKTFEDFSDKVQSGTIEPEAVQAALLWDKFNTQKMADALLNGVLKRILEQDGGRNDN